MPRSKKKKARRVSPWQGSLRIALVFVLLVGINVYFFFLRGGTSLRALLKTAELQKQAVIASPAEGAFPPAPQPKKPAPVVAEDEPDSRVVDGTMSDSDTVERAWKRDGLLAKDVNELS